MAGRVATSVLLMALLGSVCLAPCAADDNLSWKALFSGGGVQALPRPIAWPMTGQPMRIAGRDPLEVDHLLELLASAKPLETCQTPHLEMANGDILPGWPQKLVTDSTASTPVRAEVLLDTALQTLVGSTVAVRVDRIRKLSRQAKTSRNQPASEQRIEMLDGRILIPRSVRWREYGLSVLTSDGVIDCPFTEIAEATFPAASSLDALTDDCHVAGERGTAIQRYSLLGGAILTTSQSSREVKRLRRRTRSSGDSLEVYYLLQPAWSSDPIVVGEVQILACGYRHGNDIPLSLVPPQSTVHRPLTGVATPPEINRNDVGQRLATRTHEADLSILLPSHGELVFALPKHAETFSTSIGIQQHQAVGGCVKCEVYGSADDRGAGDWQRLWASDFIVGDGEVATTGLLNVKPFRSLKLVTLTAHEGRPEGADPLDIRDAAVWLSPEITIDLEASRGESVAQLLDLPAGWTLSVNGETKLPEIRSRWNELQRRWDRLLEYGKTDKLILRASASVGIDSDVLQLLTAIPERVQQHQIHLTVDGEPVEWYTSVDRVQTQAIIARYATDFFRSRQENLFPRIQEAARRSMPATVDEVAYWWDLSPWSGKEVELIITIQGDQETNEIVWHRLSQRSSVVGKRPAGMKFIEPDVRLESIHPLEASSDRGRFPPRVGQIPRGKGEPIHFLGQTWTDGYGMPRSSRLKVALKPEFRQFVAVVGCCEQSCSPLRILIDDQPCWIAEGRTQLDAAEQVVIDIPQGSRELTIESGADGSYDAYVAFAKAGFLKNRTIKLP